MAQAASFRGVAAGSGGGRLAQSALQHGRSCARFPRAPPRNGAPGAPRWAKVVAVGGGDRRARREGGAVAAASFGDASSRADEPGARPQQARLGNLDQGGVDPETLQPMVETAMLAALAGLAYTLFTTVGLDKYVGYFLPVAPIVAALRNGSAACLRTVGATFVLLLVLQGPLRASVYFFLHGSMACVMGWAISRRVRWRVAVPAAALARVFGTLGYLAMTSWVMNENLLRLLVSNVCTLLDQIAASMGTTGVPSPSTVYGLIGVLLMVNGLAYSLLLHALYAVLLKGMGYTDIFVPKFFRKYGI